MNIVNKLINLLALLKNIIMIVYLTSVSTQNVKDETIFTLSLCIYGKCE